MRIQLENGKKYVTVGGKVVTMTQITNQNVDAFYQFVGSNCFAYSRYGVLYKDELSPYDVTKEYKEIEEHTHAKLMMEYAKDALVSKTPWEFWQYAKEFPNFEWVNCDSHPLWDEDTKYRRKPKTIIINGYEVPEPIRELPNLGRAGIDESIFITMLNENGYVQQGIGNSYTKVFLERGLCHRTKEAAQLHARALLSFTTTVSESL